MKIKYCHLKYTSMFLVLFVHLFFSSTTSANGITNKIKEIEVQLNVHIGVSIYDIEADQLWNYNGNDRFPLMSTFKTLACAKLLLDVEKGTQSFSTSVVVQPSSLITWSPVTEKLLGKKISLKQACAATMTMSDNTAANIVLSGINGPSALTKFMRYLGDEVTRLDRNEPDLGEALKGDERDTTTPNAMVMSLNKLLFGSVLSQASKDQLKQWMMGNKVSDSLLRSVLPEGWLIADRSGAGGYGSRGITAVTWSAQRSPIIMSIYLTQTDASFAQRNDAIVKIGKEIFTIYNDKKLTDK
jgi:beta-lactamase class A